MAKKRQPFTFESNLEKVVEKIEEKPEKVLGTIGQSLTKEVKGTLRQFYRKRTGDLDKSVRYSQNRKLYKESTGEWPPSRKPFLMIGFNKFYAPFVLEHDDPIMPVVKKNANLIQEMIGKAIDEINKE
jgi:hypothetical protein